MTDASTVEQAPKPGEAEVAATVGRNIMMIRNALLNTVNQTSEA